MGYVFENIYKTTMLSTFSALNACLNRQRSEGLSTNRRGKFLQNSRKGFFPPYMRYVWHCREIQCSRSEHGDSVQITLNPRALDCFYIFSDPSITDSALFSPLKLRLLGIAQLYRFRGPAAKRKSPPDALVSNATPLSHISDASTLQVLEARLTTSLSVMNTLSSIDAIHPSYIIDVMYFI